MDEVAEAFRIARARQLRSRPLAREESFEEGSQSLVAKTHTYAAAQLDENESNSDPADDGSHPSSGSASDVAVDNESHQVPHHVFEAMQAGVRSSARARIDRALQSAREALFNREPLVNRMRRGLPIFCSELLAMISNAMHKAFDFLYFVWTWVKKPLYYLLIPASIMAILWSILWTIPVLLRLTVAVACTNHQLNTITPWLPLIGIEDPCAAYHFFQHPLTPLQLSANASVISSDSINGTVITSHHIVDITQNINNVSLEITKLNKALSNTYRSMMSMSRFAQRYHEDFHFPRVVELSKKLENAAEDARNRMLRYDYAETALRERLIYDLQDLAWASRAVLTERYNYSRSRWFDNFWELYYTYFPSRYEKSFTGRIIRDFYDFATDHVDRVKQLYQEASALHEVVSEMEKDIRKLSDALEEEVSHHSSACPQPTTPWYCGWCTYTPTATSVRLRSYCSMPFKEKQQIISEQLKNLQLEELIISVIVDYYNALYTALGILETDMQQEIEHARHPLLVKGRTIKQVAGDINGLLSSVEKLKAAKLDVEKRIRDSKKPADPGLMLPASFRATTPTITASRKAPTH